MTIINVNSSQNGKKEIECVCIPLAEGMLHVGCADMITKDKGNAKQQGNTSLKIRSEEMNQREYYFNLKVICLRQEGGAK